VPKQATISKNVDNLQPKINQKDMRIGASKLLPVANHCVPLPNFRRPVPVQLHTSSIRRNIRQTVQPLASSSILNRFKKGTWLL